MKFNNYGLDEDQIDIIGQVPPNFLNEITRKANSTQQAHIRERGFWKRKVRHLQRILDYTSGDPMVTKVHLFGFLAVFGLVWWLNFDFISFLQSWGLRSLLSPTIAGFYYIMFFGYRHLGRLFFRARGYQAYKYAQERQPTEIEITLEEAIKESFQIPQNEQAGQWFGLSEIMKILTISEEHRSALGEVLTAMNFPKKHSEHGRLYKCFFLKNEAEPTC